MPKWINHGEETVFDGGRLRVVHADIEISGHSRKTHVAIRIASSAVAAVGTTSDGRCLLMRRFRWIPGSQGWELPAGRLDGKEEARDAAVREFYEETGRHLQSPAKILTFHPTSGLTDHTFHLYRGTFDPTRVDAVADWHESDEIGLFSKSELIDMINRGAIVDGFTLVGVLLYAHSPE